MLQADDFLEDILNLEAGLEAADRSRIMDSSTSHIQQTIPTEVDKSFSATICFLNCLEFYFFIIFLNNRLVIRVVWWNSSSHSAPSSITVNHQWAICSFTLPLWPSLQPSLHPAIVRQPREAHQLAITAREEWESLGLTPSTELSPQVVYWALLSLDLFWFIGFIEKGTKKNYFTQHKLTGCSLVPILNYI